LSGGGLAKSKKSFFYKNSPRGVKLSIFLSEGGKIVKINCLERGKIGEIICPRGKMSEKNCTRG